MATLFAYSVGGLFTGAVDTTVRMLAWTLGLATTLHVLILVLEHLFTPSATLHHELAVRAIVRGAFASPSSPTGAARPYW